MNTFFEFLDKLPVLGAKKNPNWACVIGFLTGGLGLAIYFRSAVDFAIPIDIFIVITVVLGSVTAGLGTLAGAIVAALYGYFRAQNSNERLEATNRGVGSITKVR